MRAAEVRRLPPLERFLYWVSERQSIYNKRQQGLPPPWTDDDIMQREFFTNPYRENDKVTVWFRENVRQPLRDAPDVLFASVCFRWFVWIPTGEFLLKQGLLTHWDTPRAVKLLLARQAAGNQIFTGAYTISNGNSHLPKVNHVCETCLEPVWQDRRLLVASASKPGMTLEGFHRILGNYPGMGGSGFMAAQVIAELKYTYLLEDASDWWTWCSTGPGSIRGMNILLDRPWRAPAPQNFLAEINKLRSIVAERFPELPPMHAQDIQSCCCEFFKYERALGGGTSKRRYHARKVS